MCKDTENFAAREFTSLARMFTLKGKAALVTGAAGGIGRSTAKAFAELGANVALMDLPQKKEQLEAICKGIEETYGVKAIAVTGNVADEDSVKAFVKEVSDTFGTIDVLHNNAGIILPEDNDHVKYSDWKRMLDIDLNSVFLVGQTVANLMVDHRHGGAIINTASMSGHIWNRQAGHNYGFTYCTAKAAVMHLTKGMAANYIKYGIRINSVSPGVVLSGIHDNVPVSMMDFSLNEIPMGRFGYLDEIAGMVAVLATDLASFMVGSDVLIDGGQCIN